MLSTIKKILIVDDDPDIRTILSLILTEEGFQIYELDNGHQVLDSVLKNQPDLILLDIMLGDMDGRDVCMMLKNAAETLSIPVIMLSATHGWQSIIEKNCKADNYIEKPFDITNLVDSVKRYAA